MASSTRRYLAILLFFLVLAGLAVPKLISTHSEPEAAPETSPAPQALKVDVEVLRPMRMVEELATTGTIVANERVELVSEVAGKIVRIHFHEGTPVKAGQILVELDDSTLQAEAERIRYRLELAEQRETRQRELLDQGVISQDDYDLALNQLNVLRSEQRLNTTQLEKTRLHAPFAGVVGLRYVSPGSYLSPQTRIALLQQIDTVKIDFSVPEKYVGRLQPGSQISFSVKGHEEPFNGTVYAVEPNVDPETRSLLLRARSENPDGRLVPGAFADVRLLVEEVDDALAVPSMAVVPELGGRKVFVIEDGQAVPRSVQTGIRDADRVQVLEGLRSGETVIVSAIQQLQPGLSVQARTSRPMEP